MTNIYRSQSSSFILHVTEALQMSMQCANIQLEPYFSESKKKGTGTWYSVKMSD